MGKVNVELSMTINMGNFQGIKVNVGFEESYEPYIVHEVEDNESARNDKFRELLEVTNEKLDEAVLATVRKFKQLKKKEDND